MICKEIIEKIEECYPKNRAMQWDNVGLLVGRTDQEVSKILIALDLTDEVLECAIGSGVNLILTHHPLIFAPLKSITNQNFIGNRIVKLLQNDISYYAMHTNYDILRMADLASEMMGLEEAEALEVISENYPNEGIGKIGNIVQEISLQECCDFVKQTFALEHVKVFGDLNNRVQRIAVCPGSGKSVIDVAVRKGADVLITGDIDHHEGIDAVAKKLAIIDAGHYGLEHIYIEDMRKFLEERISNVEIETVQISSPFQVI